MKKTMKELAKEYYWMTLAELFDELAEEFTEDLTEWELCEVFAERYNVTSAEDVYEWMC
jgi:hypothetical protein